MSLDAANATKWTITAGHGTFLFSISLSLLKALCICHCDRSVDGSRENITMGTEPVEGVIHGLWRGVQRGSREEEEPFSIGKEPQ